MRALRNNCHSSKFVQYLNEHMHTFGSIQNIIQIMYYQKKGPHLQTIEGFYIHREAENDNQLNDKQSFPIKFLTPSQTFENSYPLHTQFTIPYLSPSHHTASQSIVFQHPHNSVRRRTEIVSLIHKIALHIQSRIKSITKVSSAYPRKNSSALQKVFSVKRSLNIIFTGL